MSPEDQKIWMLYCSIVNLIKLRIMSPRIPFPARVEVELAKRGTHIKFGQQMWGSSSAYSLKVFVVSKLSGFQVVLTLLLAPSPSSHVLALLMESGPRPATRCLAEGTRRQWSPRDLPTNPNPPLHVHINVLDLLCFVHPLQGLKSGEWLFPWFSNPHIGFTSPTFPTIV